MAAIFIHDLIPAVLSAVLPDTSGFSVIDANKKAACCQGCFRCWLASPGQCVMKDDPQTVGAQIGSCEKVIILSRCCYGGFSPGVKRVLDRAISLSLPFFTYRSGRVHHPLRYQNRPTLTVCFYGAVTDLERETAAGLVEANRVNIGFSAAQAFFAEQLCQEQLCHFKLYAISNCGFIEGHQNELHLRIYEAWCQCAGVCWGGGLGIGGGVILRWMCMLTALFAVLDTVPTIFSCYGSMLVTLVMSLGAAICLAVMGHRIKHSACRRNLFTRCLMPSFLFIPVSDAFMLLSALAHGNLPHTLFRRRECPAQGERRHL